MDDYLDELKRVLQLLALPVTGQVHLVTDDCTRVDQLARAFGRAHDAVRANSDRPLPRERAGALAQLDDHLRQLSGPSAQEICSELSLRRSIEWRQVRTMARESLVRFDWPLEVPQRWDDQLDGKHPRPTTAPSLLNVAVASHIDRHLDRKQLDKRTDA